MLDLTYTRILLSLFMLVESLMMCTSILTSIIIIVIRMLVKEKICWEPKNASDISISEVFYKLTLH